MQEPDNVFLRPFLARLLLAAGDADATRLAASLTEAEAAGGSAPDDAGHASSPRSDGGAEAWEEGVEGGVVVHVGGGGRVPRHHAAPGEGEEVPPPHPHPVPPRHLRLPRGYVVYEVADVAGAAAAAAALSAAPAIGVDLEWRPAFKRGSPPSAALLQLAASRNCFLIDLVALSATEEGMSALDALLERVFCAPQPLKLGYGLAADVKRLAAAHPKLKAPRAGVSGMVDLARVVAVSRPGLVARGLSGLAEATLGLPLNKVCMGGAYRTTYLLCHTQWARNETVGGLSEASFDPGRNRRPFSPRPPAAVFLNFTGCRPPLAQGARFSDWERRPLTSEMRSYATLDAACLLPIFERLCHDAPRVTPPPGAGGAAGMFVVGYSDPWAQSLITALAAYDEAPPKSSPRVTIAYNAYVYATTPQRPSRARREGGGAARTDGKGGGGDDVAGPGEAPSPPVISSRQRRRLEHAAAAAAAAAAFAEGGRQGPWENGGGLSHG